MANPSGVGGFQKGKSGNVSGRPKENEEVKRLALEASPKAMERLKAILENETDSRAVIAAAKEILDRAVGKPAQGVEVTGKDGGDLNVNVIIRTHDKPGS